jgi:hypothetical protein
MDISEEENNMSGVELSQGSVAALADAITKSLQGTQAEFERQRELTDLKQTVGELKKLPSSEKVLELACSDPSSPLCKLIQRTLSVGLESIRSTLQPPPEPEPVVEEEGEDLSEEEIQRNRKLFQHAASGCPLCEKKLLEDYWSDPKYIHKIADLFCKTPECKKTLLSKLNLEDVTLRAKELGVEVETEGSPKDTGF